MRSYERERRPVAVGNTRLSVANFDRVLEVPAALGCTPPRRRPRRDGFRRRFRSIPASCERVWRSGGRCGILLVGDNPVGNARRAAVAEMCDRSKGGAGARVGHASFAVPGGGFGIA